MAMGEHYMYVLLYLLTYVCGLAADEMNCVPAVARTRAYQRESRGPRALTVVALTVVTVVRVRKKRGVGLRGASRRDKSRAYLAKPGDCADC